ncbi:MAG: sodium:proton antiporter [Desulfobacteraceae bacterium]|nr:sodium:proton antiporter [Desulfobacteraceae bacterium]
MHPLTGFGKETKSSVISGELHFQQFLLICRLIRALSGLCFLIFILFPEYAAADLFNANNGRLTASAERFPESKSHDGKHDSESRGKQHHVSDIGSGLPLWSCLPFAFMLLSIAFWPLMAPEFWHHHFGKISVFWALSLAIPFTIIYKSSAVYEILHILLADYVPFIILLWSLYTVSGGILLQGALKGTPFTNAVMLAIGTILASWMGTTGAAMLLIRPFLKANKDRKNRTFMVVFFIFLVANIGGSLTPLGDPPLFLGFLHGVSFFWTFNIAPHMLCLSVILLIVYFCMDTYFYKKEKTLLTKKQSMITKLQNEEPTGLTLAGKVNFLYLAGIIGAVLFSGVVDWGTVNTVGVHRGTQDWLRDMLLIAMGVLSLVTTSASIRQDNDFTWFPIKEVAYLFVGIFITMIPCLLILKAGKDGAFAFVINLLREPVHYFWVTGMLSSFLDNAPTYLTFFNTALGSFFAGLNETQAVPLLMTEKSIYLKAISAGAVFFGAFSYIGNAPNFMVRSIAEEAGTSMPSFFGYIIKYSILFLVPGFIIITFLFF